MSSTATRAPLWRRTRSEVAVVVSTISLPVAALFIVSAAFSFLAFGHIDLRHTIGSSYAYLLGHWSDFYAYNQPVFTRNDYFPSIYLVFAAWMAPVKLLVSPGAQNGMGISLWEQAWGRFGLLLVFAATVHLVLLVARELFPGRPSTQRTVVAAYLLSPFIAFVVGVFGQYDILGVFFTLLGFLYYLRGDRWRFALYFAVAVSFKYFALLLFAPLLVLAYKRLRDLVALSTVALSVLTIEALVYFHDPAFRSALWGMASSSVGGAGANESLRTLVFIVFAVGLFLLWRTHPTSTTLGPLAVHAGALAYGLMFLAVTWNLVWFVILAPFFALAMGYLRRPSAFLVWESMAFLAYIWYAVHAWASNVDANLLTFGVLAPVFGPPRIYLYDIYATSAVPLMRTLLTAYFISPVLFWLVDQVERKRSPNDAQMAVRTWTWALRSATPALVWTLPAIGATAIPMPLAERITPAAPTNVMDQLQLCAGPGAPQPSAQPYGTLEDGSEIDQSLVGDGRDLGAVAFRVGTYGRQFSGSLAVEVSDSSRSRTEVVDLPLNGESDNAVMYAVLNTPYPTSAGQTYVVSFRTTGVPPGEGLVIWGSATDCDPGATLRVNGSEQAGDLALTTFFARS